MVTEDKPHEKTSLAQTQHAKPHRCCTIFCQVQAETKDKHSLYVSKHLHLLREVSLKANVQTIVS